jgi:hypothetical protein
MRRRERREERRQGEKMYVLMTSKNQQEGAKYRQKDGEAGVLKIKRKKRRDRTGASKGLI